MFYCYCEQYDPGFGTAPGSRRPAPAARIDACRRPSQLCRGLARGGARHHTVAAAAAAVVGEKAWLTCHHEPPLGPVVRHMRWSKKSSSPSTVNNLTRRAAGHRRCPWSHRYIALLHDLAPHGTGLLRQPL